MKENQEMLAQLAAKLGTTVEYLWGVLLKQAPINSTILLFYYIILVIASISLYKKHKEYSTPYKTDYGITTKYKEKDIRLEAPMLIFAIIWFLLFVILMCEIPNFINGYINPEYWALKQIIK